MTILAKCLNKNQRVYAFSLLEILIVLVIIGIILTIPRWSLISSNLLNRVNEKMQISQSKVDTAIMIQSGMSAKK